MLLVGSPAYPEPPLDGDKFRWKGLLSQLAGLAPVHAVFGYMPTRPTREARNELFERAFQGVDIVPTPNLEVSARAALLELRGMPSAFGRRATPRWRRAVKTAADSLRPSGILLLGTSGGYVPELAASTWLDLVDVRSRLRTLSGDRLVDRRILEAELALAKRHRIVVSSPSDQEWLVGHGLAADRVSIVPHGVDPALFDITPASDASHILFVGNLRYGQSLTGLQWFMRESWPKIHASSPMARLRIVGYGADRIPVSDRVEVYANVPRLEPHYVQAAVAIAPILEARGVQFKAIQAMAAGVPLVCTSPVAGGLLEGESAWEVADDPALFADRCLALLSDPARRSALARQGRAYVRTNHDWAKSARVLLDRLAA